MDNVPNKVVIIPYRNRENHKIFFTNHMNDYFENEDKIEMYFVHQMDNRCFNRGGMKNIGFLAMKNKYPNHYKNITFIFHDIDTLPRNKGILKYDTTVGSVVHHYGTTFALGGIVVIKGIDFEKITGFPNYWGWGMEDNMLQERCIQYNIKIDRSNFFPMHDKENIIRLFDGFLRVANTREPSIYKYETSDSLLDIHKLTYNIDNEFINVFSFETGRPHNGKEVREWDIRRGSKMTIPKGQCRKNWSMGLF